MGKTSVTGDFVDFYRLIFGGIRGVCKLYPTFHMSRTQLLVEEMRSIRNAMDLTTLRDKTYWDLWVCQWQGVMRGSNVLRPVDYKERA